MNSRLFVNLRARGVRGLSGCWPIISATFNGLNSFESNLVFEVTEKRFGKAPLTAFARPDGTFFRLTIALASPGDFVGLCLRIMLLSYYERLIVRGVRGI
jgi:hypothetical protein